MKGLGKIAIGSIVAAAAGLGCLDPYVTTEEWYGDRDDETSSGGSSSSSSSSGGIDEVGPPSFGETVSLAEAPPPISGGTIAVSPDDQVVVVADPDRGHVQAVSLAGHLALLGTVDVGLASRPERVAFDDAQRAHVVLRGTGEVETFAVPSLTSLARRKVCPEPRGIAWDHRLRMLHVACATGELVSLSPDGSGSPTVRLVRDDLRDVVVTSNGLRVSTFRDAKVFDVTFGEGMNVTLKELFSSLGERNVAWRMIAAPRPRSDEQAKEDDVLVAGQRPGGPVPTVPEYYGVTGCTSDGPMPVLLRRGALVPVPTAVLPVDLATTDEHIYIVAAANGHTRGAPTVMRLPLFSGIVPCMRAERGIVVPGQPTSIARTHRLADEVVVLSRQPARLHVVRGLEVETSITLSDESREDTGHAIFHANSGKGLACASCHPDGRDDGHAWTSADIGARRTPSLLGTIAGTAPYHWDGTAADMHAVADLTFRARMQGPALETKQTDALGGWLGKLPRMATAAPRDEAAVARGKALFDRAGACASCHAGPLGTNNATVDVGTGLRVQVPPLVGVSTHAPYFHDGRAATLAAVLAAEHGRVSLDAAARADVEAYLRTF